MKCAGTCGNEIKQDAECWKFVCGWEPPRINSQGKKPGGLNRLGDRKELGPVMCVPCAKAIYGLVPAQAKS